MSNLPTTPEHVDPDGANTIVVNRVTNKPIVAAGSVPGYGPIFNAGVIHHDGRFHLFARGVREGYRRNANAGARFLDYVSDVLVFTSSDGRAFVFQQVLASSSPEGVNSLRGSTRAAGADRDRASRCDVVHQPARTRVREALAGRRAPTRLRRRPLPPQPDIRAGSSGRRASRTRTR